MKQTLKQKLQSIKHSGAENLYSHLVSVLRRMLLQSPVDAYSLFEEYSVQLGNKQISQKKLIKETYDQLQGYIADMKLLLDKPNSGTEQEPAEPGPTGYVPNVLEESRWFEMAGVGFGQELSYKIFKSLERFSILKNIQQLRFWGKILGQQKDYYVAEGQSAGEVETPQADQPEQVPADVEKRGQEGINKKVYWVTTDLTKDWVELPTVTPQQMVASRSLKYLFTSDLKTQIFRNPHFAGKESHLLKCQILRITASCTMVPRDLYKMEQEEDPESNDNPTTVLNDEYIQPTFEFLTKTQNWVHHPANILRNGRMTHLPPVIPEEKEGQQPVDEDKLKKEIRMSDPFEKRLKPISEDKYLNIQGWKLSVVGDSNTYSKLEKDAHANYGYITIRSNIWKGYTLVYHNRKWVNIYIGPGFKSTNLGYFPSVPQQTLSQMKDVTEQPQPNFIPEQQPKKQDQASKEEELAAEES